MKYLPPLILCDVFQCGKGGVYPTTIAWPTCIDNTTLTTPAPPSIGATGGGDCHCVGDQVFDQNKTKEILDNLCRDQDQFSIRSM